MGIYTYGATGKARSTDVIGRGVLVFDEDTGEFKLGDGENTLDDLPPVNEGPWEDITDSSELAAAVSGIVSNVAYDADTWDGDNLHAPSKNVVRDKFEDVIDTLSVLDEDDFESDSSTKAPSQQSTFEFIKNNVVRARILRPSGDVTGVTDTAALITAAASGGGKIHLPSDEPFYFNDHGVLGSDNLVIEGDGPETELIMVNDVADKRLFNTNGHHGISFRQMTIRSLNPTTRGHALIGIMDGSVDCDVEWVWLSDVGQFGIVIGDTAANASGQHQGGGDHRISNVWVDMTNCKGPNGSAAIIAWPKGGAGYLAKPGLEVSHTHMVLGSVAEVGLKVQEFLSPKISHCDASGGLSAAFTGCFDIVQCEDAMVDHCSARDTRMGFVVGSSAGLDNGLRDKKLLLDECSVRGIIVGLGSSAYGVYSTYGTDRLTIKGGTYDESGGAANSLIGLYVLNGDVGYTNLVIDGPELIGGASAIDCGADAATGLLRSDGAVVKNINARGQRGASVKIIGDDVSLTNSRVVESGTSSINITGARHKVRNVEIFDGNTTNTASQPGLALSGDSGDIDNVHIENRAGGLGHMKFGVNYNNGSTNARRRGMNIVGMETRKYQWSGTTSQRQTEQRIDVSPINSQVVGPLTATSIKAATIYQEELGKSGGLKVRASGSVSGTAGTKTISIRAGGGILASFVLSSAAVGEWTIEAEMWLRNVSNSAVWIIEAYALNALVATFPDQVISAVDYSAADKLIEIWGAPAGSGDIINVDFMSVKVMS